MLDTSLERVSHRDDPAEKATQRLLRDLKNLKRIASPHSQVVMDHAEQHGVPCQAHPDWFHPDGHANDSHEYVEAARHLCHQCPVRAACLAWALEDREPLGIWGGTTGKERKRLRGVKP